MAVLYIFGDESGTMPVADSDPPFVAATLAFVGEYPTLDRYDGKPEWLVETLLSEGGVPFVAYVKPVPGFGHALNVKFDLLSGMAELTRKTTRANAKYVSAGGPNLRNQIWSWLMLQAAAQAILSGVQLDSIHSVQAVLDRKTLAPGERRLVRDQFAEVNVRAIRSFPVGANEHEIGIAEGLRSRVRFSKATTSLKWSDEEGTKWAESGLKLAHYLASLARRAVRGGHNGNLFERLGRAGFRFYAADLTANIVAPLDPESVTSWLTLTGARVE